MNLCQHVKNEAISLICSGDMVDERILQSDWLRTFWLLSQEQTFLKYEICGGTKQIISIFIIDQIQ